MSRQPVGRRTLRAVCRTCNGIFFYVRDGAGAPRLYCSVECARHSRNEGPRMLNSRCRGCGGIFVYEHRCGRGRIWCSERCRRLGSSFRSGIGRRTEMYTRGGAGEVCS